MSWQCRVRVLSLSQHRVTCVRWLVFGFRVITCELVMLLIDARTPTYGGAISSGSSVKRTGFAKDLLPCSLTHCTSILDRRGDGKVTSSTVLPWNIFHPVSFWITCPEEISISTLLISISIGFDGCGVDFNRFWWVWRRFQLLLNVFHVDFNSF